MGTTVPNVAPSPPRPERSRRRRVSVYKRLAERPSVAAAIGLVVIWTAFALTSSSNGFATPQGAYTYLNVAGEGGIIASAVTLLLITGEFDLSVGAMVGFSSMFLAISIRYWNWSLPEALGATLGLALTYGFMVGQIVVRTGLPSFLVTLGGLYFLTGLSIGFSEIIVGVAYVDLVLEHVTPGPLLRLFSGDLVPGLNMTVPWWLALSFVAFYVLNRTKFGNWIYAVGGSGDAARGLGVPVGRVKTVLFMGTASSAALLAIIQVLTFGSADPSRGMDLTFAAAIMAFIGGTPVTGGYGSPIGSIFGASILGVVKQGLFFVGLGSDWYETLLGVVLFVVVLFGQFVRKQAARTR